MLPLLRPLTPYGDESTRFKISLARVSYVTGRKMSHVQRRDGIRTFLKMARTLSRHSSLSGVTGSRFPDVSLLFDASALSASTAKRIPRSASVWCSRASMASMYPLGGPRFREGPKKVHARCHQGKDARRVKRYNQGIEGGANNTTYDKPDIGWWRECGCWPKNRKRKRVDQVPCGALRRCTLR